MSAGVKPRSESQPVEEPQDQTVTPRPFWRKVLEHSSQVPEEAWERVPTDGSINYRHTLYGTPVRK